MWTQMKRIHFPPIFTGTFLGVVVGLIVLFAYFNSEFLNPIVEEDKNLPLLQYSIPNLRKNNLLQQSPNKNSTAHVRIGAVVDYGDSVVAKKISFSDVVAEKKVSGVITFPRAPGKLTSKNGYPLVIMFRGYVDKEIYRPGIGNQRTATWFSEQGFITVTPDFLGYGDSDIESTDSLEARFQTYTTALSILASLDELKDVIKSEENIDVDTNKVAIWGHSNGGQIAMTVMAMTGNEYPVMLWAPVSKQFPDSILAFADEQEDGGAYLRTLISDFDADYDMRLYAFNNYLHLVKAPIQLHQGRIDDAIPAEWSQTFVEELGNENIDVAYYEYPDENHNFTGGSWDTVVARDLEFIKKFYDL